MIYKAKAAVLIIIIISIQPEGRFWQEPEPSQATGMALAHCILGSFLGVVCHCFPPPLDFPTFASRCLHVQATWETSISERRNYGREMAGQFCLWFRLPRKPRVGEGSTVIKYTGNTWCDIVWQGYIQYFKETCSDVKHLETKILSTVSWTIHNKVT